VEIIKTLPRNFLTRESARNPERVRQESPMLVDDWLAVPVDRKICSRLV
jgi:hypothetical protein